MKFDGKAFGQEIVSAVKTFVGEQLAPILKRLGDIEARAGIAGALIDRGGNLVLTLTDDTTRELGAVVGKDGDKGEPGRDGADGVGFDDVEVIHDGARGFTFRFAKSDRVKEFPFTVPVMIYRGVFKEGETYQRGDTCTWGGSLWHCDADTADKPDGQQKHWTLAAKRGRDGKDGVLKPSATEGGV
jgi:integrin beta 3